MSSRFKYEPRSADSVKERINQSSGDYDSYLKKQRWKVAEGNHTIRILPRTWDKKKFGDNWGIQIWVHYNIGPDNAAYLCLSKMKGEDCPLCAAASGLERDDAYEIKAKKRILAWVIDRDNEKAGPVIWDMGWKNEQEIQTQSLDTRTGSVVNIEDPEEGYDLDFVRRGTGKTNTNYGGWRIARRASPIHDKESKQEVWLDFITENALPTMLRFYEPDYLSKVFAGKGKARDEDDEDEDEKPKKRKKDEDEDDDRPTRRKKDEDEDEDEKPRKRRRDEDDEDEDEKPKKRKKDEDEDEDDDRSSRRRKDDDEEEDEKPRKRRRDDDEDEEDEKPKKRRKDDDDEDEDEKPRKRRDEDDEDEDEKPKKKRKSDDADEEEDEKPSKRKKDEDEDEDEDESVSRARKSVNKLKEDTKKGGGQKRR